MALKIKAESNRYDDSLFSNHLHLNIKGEDINFVIINSLRRVILEDIPGFAFNINKIKIKRNSSVYNNDYLKNRLENFPIYGIENNFDINEYDELKKLLLEKKVVDINEEENLEFNKEINEDGFTSEKVENTNIKNINMLNMYLKKENNTDEILNVTTDDCEFFLNGVNKKKIYKNPMLICKLKKDEEIELSAIVDKNLPQFHTKYSVVGSCVYEERSDTDYLFKFDNRSELKNVQILSIACDILVFRLKKFLERIKKEKFTTDNHGKIIINQESHTLGNLVSRGLQDNPNIEYAAYKKDHLLIDDVTIEYITNGSKSINEILNNSVTKQIKLFENLKDSFIKLK